MTADNAAVTTASTTPPRSALLRRLPALVLLALLCAAAWFGGGLDARATRQADAGLQRALASFATARALHALISVAQGTALAVQPAGVGTTLAVGQALAPVADLVEKFSTVMLIASVSFGVQKLLIAIGGSTAVSLVLTLLALAWGAFHVRSRASPVWLARLLAGLLLVRFAVPLVALGNEAAYRHFLAPTYETSQSAIDQSARRVEAVQSQGAPPAEAAGLGRRLREWWDRAADLVDVGQRLRQLRDGAAQAVDRMVDLIVVFVLQTVVLPLALLWLLAWLARALVAPPRPA
ncbi:hypothetical protein [Xylophilus sp.]|uniref:hypothetical protein n=1 Tax=Xylophilus sp. TaxID=2653893 RepID=UPI0013B5F080|nr:hypothetical protein [Xylophilus sp.]KAF1048125.1 MAG: hypothetical protein GAK38_01596 [Xylophilus sp.]